MSEEITLDWEESLENSYSSKLDLCGCLDTQIVGALYRLNDYFYKCDTDSTTQIHK